MRANERHDFVLYDDAVLLPAVQQARVSGLSLKVTACAREGAVGLAANHRLAVAVEELVVRMQRVWHRGIDGAPRFMLAFYELLRGKVE